MKLAWLLLLPHASLVWSAVINVTVDNKYGDPRTGAQFVYSPNGAWFDEPGCSTCKAQPDPSQAYNGTWIDSTFSADMGSNPFPNDVPTASINFTGSAIYIYCIIAPSIGPTFLTFLLDDQVVGSYYEGLNERRTDELDDVTRYSYNVLVYANTSITEGTHSIMLKNGVENGPLSLVLFDYLTYSTNDLFAGPSNSGGPPYTGPQGTTTSSKPSRIMLVAIVFGTAGGLLLVILTAILCHCMTKKGYFSNIDISFRLPKLPKAPKLPSRIFHSRNMARVRPSDPPSFSPSRLVQRFVPDQPEPLPLVERAPRRLVSPVRDHASLPATRGEFPFVPRRRRDTEPGDNYRFLSMTLHGNQRNSSLIPALSHQQTSDASDIDIVSQDPPSSSSSDHFPPPVPPPVRTSRPPRRLTVRNN